MKSYLLKYLGLGIVLCVAISAGADVCMSGTLASLSSQPCSIGAATFNFFSPDNLNPSNVAVSIITGASVGFTFTIPEQVGAASAIQVVGFNVTTETGTNITTAEIAVSSGFQGAVENACLGPGNNFNGFEPDGTVACLLDTQKLRLVAGFGSPLSSNA